MTSSDMQGGSRLSFHTITPSIDLATLTQRLGAALPVAQGAGLAAQPLFAPHGAYLRVNIAGVVERLLQHADFQNAFAPGAASGFLRDAPLPPFGMRAKMGGRILHDTQVICSKALENLHSAVQQELAAALPHDDFAALAQQPMQQVLEALSKSLGVSAPRSAPSANMVSVQFAERRAAQGAHNLARALVGVESRSDGAWAEQFLAGVARKLEKDGEDAERIEEITALLRCQSQVPGAQMQRFLHFLEEQAMGRVRMQVEMSIMAALANRAPGSKLHIYVSRVLEAFSLFAGEEGQALLLDVSSVYGQNSNVALHEELRSSTFYYCLPVWCAAAAQLLDQVAENGDAMRRAVSYRFRINGINPETNTSAFAARLERIRERLFPEQVDLKHPVRREIAQLVFLYLVVPAEREGEYESGRLLVQAQNIVAALADDPQAALQKIYDALNKRQAVMQSIASEVMRQLKNQSASLVSAANGAVRKLYISVNRSIVRWNMLEGLSQTSGAVLVTAEQGHDSVAWLEHIQVGAEPAYANMASLCVETQLEEHVITTIPDAAYSWPMHKKLDALTIPVRIIPHTWDGDAWRAAVAQPALLAAGYGVQLEYDPAHLMADKRAEKSLAEQLRAAQLVASAMLMYVVLFTLVNRVKAAMGQRQLAMVLLRLQLSGKALQYDEDANGSDTPMYAISQALERVLSRELPVKLQGLVVGKADKKNTASKWQKEGTLAALLGGQPVSFAKKALSTRWR